MYRTMTGTEKRPTEIASAASGAQASAAPPLTVDPAELARFAALAAEWWDPDGKFRPLHKIGPARLGFVRDRLARHFGLATGGMRPLAGLRILDVGCGGGLVSEPLCRMGATVTGIEPAEVNIAAARAHAAGQGLAIDYRAITAEGLAERGEVFDAVVCLEVVEHVPDVRAFFGVIHQLVRPGGMVVLSTLNRTVKSFALAIVGAEYILRWLPVGTHQWERFITPDELVDHAVAVGLVAPDCAGLVYDLFGDTWSIACDLDVNYMLATARPSLT